MLFPTHTFKFSSGTPFSDNSVSILNFNDDSDMNLVITHEELGDHQTCEAYAIAQYGVLEKSLPQFQKIESFYFSASDKRYPAIDFEWISEGQKIRQFQIFSLNKTQIEVVAQIRTMV